MSTAPQPYSPSPALLFDTLNAYQRTAALHGAIELDLFTAVGEGHRTAGAIAERIQASEKGTRILCDFLTVTGFLNKDGREYSLTQDSSVFLDRRSPSYLGSVADFLGVMTKEQGAFDDIAAIVRKGGTVMDQQGSMRPDNPLWVNFARSMAPMMVRPAALTAQLIGAESGAPCKVLDIAAGHGLYGIAIATRNPNASIVALDWAAVLEVARENAQKAGVASRYSTLPGSVFEVELGTGYQVVLLTNFLHHFDVPTNERLLRKVHAALAPGGRAVTLEFVPNEDRISPPADAMFGLIMLGMTEGGDAYTFSDYQSMFQKAGFARSELCQLSPLPNRAIVSYK